MWSAIFRPRDRRLRRFNFAILLRRRPTAPMPLESVARTMASPTVLSGVVKVCSISQVCGIGGAQLMSQSSRAAGRPSLPRQMRVTQCLSEVRLRVCALQKSERGIVIFFRSFIARNLKVTLQISFRCFLGTTVSFRIESVKLIRFHAHCRFDMSFFDIFRCDIFRCLVSVIHIYGTHRKIR